MQNGARSRVAYEAASADADAAFAAALRVTARQSAHGAGDLTRLERALPALLAALQWGGQARHLIEALPHVDPISDHETLSLVLERLGYETCARRLRLEDCAESNFPLYFEDRDGAWVVTGRDAFGQLDAVSLADSGSLAGRKSIQLSPPTHAIDALCVAPATPIAADDAQKAGWFSEQVHALRDPIVGAVALTLFINGFAVAAPLFSMFVYNTAIPSGSFDTLVFAVAIVAIALLAEDQLRRLRGELMARFAGDLHGRIMRSGLKKLLSLPIVKIETVSATAQLAQLRRFEGIVALFHGPVAMTLLDLPFALIFVLLIALLAGPLALIPVAVALIFVILSALSIASAKRSEALQAEARRNAQELLRETVISAETIRGVGAERLWLDRLRGVLGAEAEAIGSGLASQQLSASLAQFITALAATAMLAAGAMLALEDLLSGGALIAVIMLMWKVLAPFQSAFLSVSQLRTFREDVQMTDQLMRMPDESRRSAAATIYRRFEGSLAFEGVGFRYSQEREFALRNLTFSLSPGERLGVIGASGAGRNTMLRLATGLYEPTIGAVSIDGLPLSQLHTGELRAAFAFAPARAEFFYGTIAQNVRLARNDVSEQEIELMLEVLELPLEPSLFPDGVETRLTARARADMGPATLQKLNIARALLSRRSFLLMEDPTAELDRAATAALLGQLEARRGESTTIVTSNQRDLLATCDKVMVLRRGQVAAFGPPEAIFKASS